MTLLRVFPILKPIKDFWRLSKPYWLHSEERWVSMALYACSIILSVGIVQLSVRLNDWGRDFYDALQKFDSGAFPHLLGLWGILVFGYLVVFVSRFYIDQLVQIRWRRWMNENFTKRWLASKSYYLTPLLDKGYDNPDQRIADDLNLFTSQTMTLISDLLTEIMTLWSFSIILYRLSEKVHPRFFGHEYNIPGYLLGVALLYTMISTLISHYIGRILIPLDIAQQRVEANYRFSLIRIRENAESIALNQGEAAEDRNLQSRFGDVYDNFMKVLGKRKNLVLFNNLQLNLSSLLPLFVAAPNYFAKTIQLGDLMQISNAFGQVKRALSYFTTNYSELAQWRSVCVRLVEFEESLARANTKADVGGITGTQVASHDLTLAFPNGTAFVKGVKFQVQNGERLLITGHSGSGKSTLIKAISGIWPFYQGQVARSTPADTLYLPQKPYLPIDTLRGTVSYPRPATAFSDEAIAEALRAVHLEHLLPRLDEVAHWSQILSLGEQQRLAFARVFLVKPRWVVMDEATSSLDDATGDRLYTELRQRLKEASIISVAHRDSLKKFHTHQLHFATNGSATTTEFQKI